MANFKADNRSFLYGLSDFWLSFFKEIDQLDYLYKGAEIQVGQTYLDLMALLLTNSVQDTPIFNKEYFKYIEIDEDELELVDDEYRYKFDDSVVSLNVLNNKILEPTEALEKDADFRVDADTSEIYFTVDPTNAYFEETFGSANSQFKLQSRIPGDDGGLITLELVDDGTSPVTVSRDQYAITVNYDGPANTATSSTANIVQAINTFDATKGLVIATVEGINNGAGSPAGFVPTPLLRTDVAPLKGFATKLVDKTFGGKFTVSGVTDWISLGVRKGDILRLQGGAETDHRIAIVRKGALYIDASTPFEEAESRDDWTILRELTDNESNNEGYTHSGIAVRSGLDGTIDASSSTIQSPTFNLLDIYEGDFVEILGVDNNGYAKILDVVSSVNASIGGIALTDETPVAWNLISTIDTGNTGTDGVITTNALGKTIFSSASATFTVAVAGTNIRTYESGNIEHYAIKAYISPTEVELVETVADKTALTWGWEKLKTADTTLLFSPPTAFPIAETVEVSARRAVDAAAVTRDVDYTVNETTGVVKATNVWLTSVTNTVSYEYLVLVTDSSTHGTATLTLDPKLEVQRIAMWGPDALVDKFMLYNTYGYLLGKFDKSSEQYRAFIRGVFQLFMLGPTLGRMESAVNTLAGLPVIRDDEEVLISYDSEAVQSGNDGTFTFTGSTFSSPTAVFDNTAVGNFIYPTSGFNAGKQFTITEVVDPNTVRVSPQPITSTLLNDWEYSETGTQSVTTSRATYELPRVVPVKEDLQDPTNFGVLELSSFEAIADVFSVVDYVESPTWWEYVLIPRQLMPEASPDRRQSTPVLYENLVNPADSATVGDPGFYIGADSEGTVPTPTLIRDDAGAADGVLIADPLYPASSINTYFESATGAFTSSDLGSQVLIDGVYYPVVEVVSATRLRITTYVPVTNSSGLSWELYTYPLAKRNKAAFVVLDEYLKYHLFSVSFDLSLLEIMQGDFLADMQSLVVDSRPSHTYMVLSPAALLIDVIRAAEEFEVSPVIGLGGSGGTPISYNQNALTIGTSWKVGSWFRYLENSSSFVAPQATLSNVLGAAAAGFTNYVTKWAPDFTQFTVGSGAATAPWTQEQYTVLSTSTGAEVVTGGTEAEITFPEAVDSYLYVGYVTLTGSGSGNNGTYKVTRVESPDTLYVYAPAGLTAEAGLDYTLSLYGTLQGRIWTDDDGVSYLEDLQGVFVISPGDPIEDYWVRRLTPLSGEEPAFRILEVINDHQYRLGVNRSITVTMDGDTSGNNVTITESYNGFEFTALMAENTAPDSSEIYYVTFTSGTHSGESRKILTYVNENEVVVDGGVLATETGVTFEVTKDVHYSTGDIVAEWELVRDLVLYDVQDISLLESGDHDAGSVDYTAEGVRIPDDPTLETFDAVSGDTYFHVGMQDPLANGGRKFSSKDIELRDEPIQIRMAPTMLFSFSDLTWTRSSEAAFFDPRTNTFQGLDETRVLGTPPSDASLWSTTSTPAPNITGGQADPFGGTGAALIEDDDGANYEWVADSFSYGLAFYGETVTFEAWLKEDPSGPIVQQNLIVGGDAVRYHLDVSNGDNQVQSTAGVVLSSSSTATLEDGWWHWTMTLATRGGSVKVSNFYPAITDGAIGTQAVAGVGSVTLYVGDFTVSGAYKTDNTGRIFSDGAALFEEARTNQLRDNRNLTTGLWSTLNSPTVTAAAATGPDGGLCSEIAFAAGGAAGQVRQTLTSGTFAGQDVTVSVFLRTPNGAGSADLRIFYRDTNLTTIIDQTVTVTEDWQRFNFTATDTGGTGGPLFALIEITDGATFYADLGQVEAGNFPTSPIRTSGAAATRASEIADLASAPLTIREGRWSFDFQPLTSSAEFVATGSTWDGIWSFDGAGTFNDRIIMSSSGSAAGFAVYQGGSGKVTRSPVTYDRLTRMTLTLDSAAGELTIAGATSGDGTTTGTPWTFADTPFHAGASSSGAAPMSGILHPPIPA